MRRKTQLHNTMTRKFTYLLLAILCLNIAPARAEEMPTNYYAHADGLADAVLKDSLKSIIRNHTAIPYGTGANSTWGVFFYSDRNEEGYIMDMYCDQWYKVSSPGEVASGCNIEHSFAKSWWGGGSNDAYKDCYHLNPSNSTANSSRSNYPLGVPVKEFKSNTGSLKVGKIHHDELNVDFFVFEPKDEYKGDFARAYFYMATCYGHWLDKSKSEPVLSQYGGWRLDNPDVGSKFAMQNDNYLEFQPWEQDILIAWHRQDPVSIKEIRRQDAVSNFQHNRNPYIDYPYLAEYIWGERAGEALDMTLLMASFDDDFVPGVSNGLRDGSPVIKPKHGVIWMVDGEPIQIDSIYENKKIQSLPETPTSCSSSSSKFMGWTPTPINGTADEAPERLYTTAKDIPSVAADMVLYAVFARKTVYDDGEPASFIFDDDHQDGWTVNASNTGGYWLLDAGHSVISPSLNLAGLSSITVKIRTYGGKQYNTLNVTANDVPIATITTTTGTEPTEYTWTNKGAFTGTAPLTFSTNYGNRQGVGLISAQIEATGRRIVFSDYITSCNGVSQDISSQTTKQSTNQKFIKDGRLYIRHNNHLYTPSGARIE